MPHAWCLSQWLLRLEGQATVGESPLRGAVLSEKIETIHRNSRATYGAPRVHAELRALGIRCGRKRVARLMRRARLRGCLRGRRMKTTYRPALQQAAPDLLGRNFVSEEPDRLWVADITYVRSKEGFVYLAFILDVCTRRVVSWSMATHLRTEIVVDALQMAIARRKPAPGLVHHSDRGCRTLRCRSAGGYRTRGSSLRWAGWAVPTTTPWRRAVGGRGRRGRKRQTSNAPTKAGVRSGTRQLFCKATYQQGSLSLHCAT